MAVYDGTPSIRLEGDEKRALALIPEAKALLYEVQTFIKRAEVSTFSMSRRVDEDSFIYALSTNGVNILHISVSPEYPGEVSETPPTLEPTEFPDFYSGFVYGGTLGDGPPTRDGTRPGVCQVFSPTPACQQQFSAELSMGRQSVTRLAVKPWPAFSQELENPSLDPPYTQYAKLRSSMYSGSMKKVAQLAMGLGRIKKSKLRDPSKYEPDDRYIKDVGERGVQIRYDWRFSRTHGITFGSDGTPWLVEISISRGVLAMPLPIFPKSDTAGFRERAENRGDRAMTRALDELGFLPTGEAFPNTALLLEERIASGDVLRLLSATDLREFYKCSSYSSSMGWCFTESGHEAHNTGYYFDEIGFQRSVWYQINLFFGPIVENRGFNEPVASGSAVLRRISEGFIWCPRTVNPVHHFVPIKFYEPLLPGLLSHDGTCMIEAAGLPAPKVDTVMFVCFIDGDLKTIRYYRNPKQDNYNNVDDPRYPGECLLAGSWTITTVSGSRSFPPMMYTNDFDDRRVVNESKHVVNINSEDLGYDPPKFSDFLTAPDCCYIWRERVFRRTTTTEASGGENPQSCIAIPNYSREAYYYAEGNFFATGHTFSVGIGYDVVLDPNVGYGWRCFPRISAPPFPPGRDDCNTRVCRGDANCTAGGIGHHKERRVMCLAHESISGGPWVVGGGGGDNCSDFADSGTWLSVCQGVDGFNQQGMDKTTSWFAEDRGTDERAALKYMASGQGGPVDLTLSYMDFEAYWMRPSPDPDTFVVHHVHATQSGLGSDLSIFGLNLTVVDTGVGVRGYAPDTIGYQDEIPAIVGVNSP